MTLRQFQEAFSRSLLAQGAENEFRHLRPYLAGGGQVAPEIGFAAYRGNRSGGLIAALTDFYPTIRGLVSEQCFAMLAERFVSRYPAQCDNLNDYGKEFADFLAEEMAELPLLVDAARVDWHWHRLFYAADILPLTPETLSRAAQIDPAALFFALPPGTELIKSDYPLLAIRHYAQQPEELRQDDGLAGDGCLLVMWRRHYERRIEAISPTTWNLLTGIAAGLSFQSIADSVFADLPEDALPQALSEAITKGWIAAVAG